MGLVARVPPTPRIRQVLTGRLTSPRPLVRRRFRLFPRFPANSFTDPQKERIPTDAISSWAALRYVTESHLGPNKNRTQLAVVEHQKNFLRRKFLFVQKLYRCPVLAISQKLCENSKSSRQAPSPFPNFLLRSPSNFSVRSQSTVYFIG